MQNKLWANCVGSNFDARSLCGREAGRRGIVAQKLAGWGFDPYVFLADPMETQNQNDNMIWGRP
ncbi:MAG: hypothetical protein ABSD73_02410 [Candidatus Bathyarchaeia archaeon]